MSIVQLLYVSRAVRPMTEAELIEITDHACRKNGRLGVTGLLMYGRGNFIQVLEGEARVIDDLMQTISEDSRHKDVQVLLNQPIRARLFRQWGMGLSVLHGDRPLDREHLEGIRQLAEQAPHSNPRRTALEVLSEFRDWARSTDTRAA